MTDSLDNLRIADVLEWQVRLWNWWQTEYADLHLKSFPITEAMGGEDGKDAELAVDLLKEMQQRTLEMADPWLVTEDIVDIVSAVYEDMPHDPLVESDLPSPSGFVMLRKPFLSMDRHGRALATRAFSWSISFDAAQKRIIFITLYGHVGDSDDYTDEVRDLRMKAELAGMADLRNKIPDMAPTGLIPLPFNDDVLWEDDVRKSTTSVRWVLAFWRFVGQELVGRVRDYAPRGARRDAQRAGIDHDGYITTIRLRRRRYVQRDHEETGRTLDHRHVVSHHWRRVYYPSLGFHRPVLILPYIRGPEDAPLRVRRARGVIVDR